MSRTAAATSSPLRVERDGGVAILTLDRPEVLNAFDEALTDALGVALRDAAADAGVRAVVITGAGRAFSAGQDLRDRASAIERRADLRLGDELRRRYHPAIVAIRTMRKPVIAAVNGVAAGAGFGLAVSCDIRVASTLASFRAAWAKVGLVPDAGSAFFLPRLVGWGRAVDLMLTGRAVGADEALATGLVTTVWSEAEFASGWHTLARELAEGPTEALALTKIGLNAAWEQDLAAFLETEATLQDRAGSTADFAEGVQAFRAKRPARFTGR